MKTMRLLQAMSGLDEDLVLSAPRPPRRIPWARWAAAAACLCLVIAAAVTLQPKPGTPAADAACDLPTHVEWNDQTYIISPYMSMQPDLPEGYSLAGENEEGPFYASEATPEWVYVWQEVYTDGTLDEHNTLRATDPHHEYVRYVDARLRGRHLICRGGRLYEQLLGSEGFDDLMARYGPRLEGDLPEGFVSLGTAEFSGLDTVPAGALSCNTEEAEVFADPSDDRVLLLPTRWYTAPLTKGGEEVVHHGFTVYVPCVDKLLLEMLK